MRALPVPYIQTAYGHPMLILPYHLSKSAHSWIHVLIMIWMVLLNSTKSIAAFDLLDNLSFEETLSKYVPPRMA